MKPSMRICINIDRIFWFILIVLFIKPGYFDTIPILDFMFTAARVLIFFILVLRLVLINRQYSKVVVLTAAYAGIPVIMTIVYSGDLYSAIKNASIILGSVLLMQYMEEKRHTKMISDLCLVMETLIYINLATILLFPKGLWMYRTDYNWNSSRFWFFGLRNIHTTYLMFGCFLSAINLHFSKKNIRNTVRCVAIHAASAVTIILIDSGAGYIMMTAYALLMVVVQVIIKKRLSFQLVVWFHVVLFYAITWFSATTLFSDFFLLFGKEGTATGRLSIWFNVWQWITKKPFLGYGIMKTNELVWLKKIAAGATTGHNTMIDILFRGGYVTFVFFIILLLAVGNNLKRCSADAYLYNLISISFASFFLTFQTEGGFAGVGLFMMVGLLWCMPAIFEKNQVG